MFITSWELFVEHAKKKCSKAAFDNWLAPVEVIDCSDEEVVLSIPNIFVQEYLLSNYKSELKAYLPVNAEGEPAIRFVVEAPKKAEPKAPPSAPSQPAPPKSSGSESLYQIRLNKNYKFSSFIEGASNQFIKSAALGAATRPGLSYNPLFIHGGVGLGKTHILHSIGHHITENHSALRIQCITTEGFINDLVDNLRKKSIDQMKRFYRSEIDVLLIDDIQFLQDRLNFQEEICNTFETLINYNKQIVITSDKPPGQLKLSERMIARMEWGLVAHMGIPDLETRVAILKHKAEQKGLDLSSDIAFHIAEHIYQNVRQLEGAINRLSAHCRLLNRKITPELVQNTIGDMFQTPSGQTVSIEEILETVSKVFKVPVSEIKGKKRTDQVAIARQVAMYLAKEFVKDSLVALANYFHKSHSTVLHACRSVESKIKEQDDPKLKDLKLKVGIAKRHLEHV